MLEDLDSKIPKSKNAAENALKDCIKRKRIQKFSKSDAKTFLAKAHYHLHAAESFEAENFADWALIAYYAAMYMAAKAFTAYFRGEAAKDHGCTIALMLEILGGKKFAKNLGGMRKKFEKEIELMAQVRQFRNSALYTVTEIKQADISKVGKIAFNFVDGIDQLLG